MKKLAIAFGLLILITGLTYAQAPAAVEAEFDQVYNQIMELKAADAEVQAELEARFFELQAIVYPERVERMPGGTLDQGLPTCPGQPLLQPEVGQDTVYFDTGTTINRGNNCIWSSCGRGADVFYTLTITHQDCVLVTTCGSQFDTKLCVFKEDPEVEGLECCNPDYLYAENDNNSAVCGERSLTSAIGTCFTPGIYYIVVDGYATTSQGSYSMRIEFFANDCITPEPEAECPEDFIEHVEFEGSPEEPCGFTTVLPGCPQGYCGIIDGPGDLDVYSITLFGCSALRVYCWADDTEEAPGGTGFENGLDSKLVLYTTTCEAPISQNSDINGGGLGLNPPVGTDSQLDKTGLAAGVTYYIEVSGENGTDGPYELYIDCYNCDD